MKVRSIFCLLMLTTLATMASAGIPTTDMISTANPSHVLHSVDSSDEPEESASEICRKLGENPNDSGLRLQYADALFESKDTSSALAEYKKVRKVDEYNPHAIIGAAYCYEAQGDWRVALSECRYACDHSPDDLGALLAYLYMAHKHDTLKQASKSVENLEAVNKPEAAACYEAIGEWIVVKDYWGAQPYARLAHKLDPVAFPKDTISDKPISAEWRATPANGKTKTKPAKTKATTKRNKSRLGIPGWGHVTGFFGKNSSWK
jgi:tetratricopeptide (TPR) repeat protein